MFKLTLLPLLVPAVTAHFLLTFPASIGFSDDKEATGPCGSFDPKDRKTVTDFPVSGSGIGMKSTHPETTWFFRAAQLSDTNNWIDLGQGISQVGQGEFCSTGVNVPDDWIGQDGVIQVVAGAPDGFLFQCAAVKFTEGTTSGPPSACKNGTGITAEYVNENIILDAQMTTIVSGSQPAPTGTDTMTMTDTSTKATGTPAATTTTSTTPNNAVRNGGSLLLAAIMAGLGLLAV